MGYKNLEYYVQCIEKEMGSMMDNRARQARIHAFYKAAYLCSNKEDKARICSLALDEIETFRGHIAKDTVQFFQDNA